MGEKFDQGLLDALGEGDGVEEEEVVSEEESGEGGEGAEGEDDEGQSEVGVEGESGEGEEEEEGDEDEEEEGEEDEDEDDDVDSQAAVMSAMMEEIKALRKEVQEARKNESEEPSVAEEAEKAISFVADDEQFNEAISSREDFNKVLNTVFEAGQSAVMQQLPAMVQRAALKEIHNYEVVRDFYQSNPDLKKVTPLVKVVSEELAAEWAGKDVDQKKLLTEVAKRTRARMSGGKKKGSNVVDAKRRNRNPGAVRTSGARRGNGKQEKKAPSVGDEIMAMTKL